jgi:hypothetical protein
MPGLVPGINVAGGRNTGDDLRERVLPISLLDDRWQNG